MAKKPAARPPNVLQRKKAATQTAFLAAFEETGNISRAAIVAKISRDIHYKWMREPDSDYPERFADAEEVATDSLEAEARRRALEGVDEPVGWWKGEPGGVVKRYSDTLLIFLLKGARPTKYRERFEHMGKDGAPLPPAAIQVQLVRAPQD